MSEATRRRSQRVGVIGAGVMGAGVAEVFARAGHDVMLVDIEQSALEGAMRAIRDSLRLARLTERDGQLDPNEVMGRISTGLRVAELRDRDFIVENVTEDLEVKRDLYRELDRKCRPECILAVNTSAIPISRIAAEVAIPERVIGTHFMNPVPMKNAVEVISGRMTDSSTVQQTVHLLESLGMEPILVRDSPGFVSNRVLMLTINEAVFLVHEEVASPRSVDTVFRKCFGHPMGPLETADLIGLDTILRSLEVLRTELLDSKFDPCPLLVRMVGEGHHGRKTGRGFYEYGPPQTAG